MPNCQLSFSHLGVWNGDFFLIAPFPDHCLLVPFGIFEIKIAGIEDKEIIQLNNITKSGQQAGKKVRNRTVQKYYYMHEEQYDYCSSFTRR